MAFSKAKPPHPTRPASKCSNRRTSSLSADPWSARRFILSLLSGAAALSACAVSPEPHADPGRTGTNPVPEIAPSPHPRLGTLVEVDLEKATAIALRSPLAPEQPGDLYVSVDASLNPTGVLQRAPYRFGEHQAFFILGGEPLPGDEVILPGDSSFDGLLDRFVEENPDARP